MKINTGETSTDRRRRVVTCKGVSVRAGRSTSCGQTQVSPTGGHGERAAQLLQGFLQSVHLPPLDEGLEAVELLQDGGWLGAGGDAAREVIDDPKLEAGLVCVQRCWRTKRKRWLFH